MTQPMALDRQQNLVQPRGISTRHCSYKAHQKSLLSRCCCLLTNHNEPLQRRLGYSQYEYKRLLLAQSFGYALDLINHRTKYHFAYIGWDFRQIHFDDFIIAIAFTGAVITRMLYRAIG